MRNATRIYNAATEKLQGILGEKYKPLSNQFSVDNEDAASLAHGFKVILGKFSQWKTPANALFIEREIKIEITSRVYATANSNKIVAKLQDAYELEGNVIAAFNAWQDKSIGLLATLPSIDGEIEQDKDAEQQYLISKMTLKIQYLN